MTRRVQPSFRKPLQFERMARCVRPIAILWTAVFVLAGCGLLPHAERPAWRAQADKACFAEGRIRPSSSIRELGAMDGPGICGLDRPLRVSALKEGSIALDKAVVMDCPMAAALEDWLDAVVQPAAMSRFGAAVTELDVFGAYACRTVDNLPGEKLSEHSFGNAVDVSGFGLADGRKIVIVRDWKKTDTQEAAFLHEAHAGACDHFTTVLGPGADVFHYNHFHLDLAMHGRSSAGARRFCRPATTTVIPPPSSPRDGLPPAPDVDEPMDVAASKAHRATPSFAETPVNLHGPDFAFPSAVGTQETEYAPPILPNGVDPTPTSANSASTDD